MAVTNFYTVASEMIGYKTGGTRKDFLTDNLGSVTAEYDETGTNRTFDGRYRPYGNSLWSTGTRGAFGWVGSFGYRSTGLNSSTQYIRARHYSNRVGIWTTIDPLWPEERKYCYSLARPTLMIDFTGKTCGAEITNMIVNTPYGPRACGATHPCLADPCGYAWKYGDQTVSAYVACCMGTATICLSPDTKTSDPTVQFCTRAHEQDHIDRNPACNDPNMSGCRLPTLKGRDMGNGWFDTTEKLFECLGWTAGINCLADALKKHGCTTPPKFSGSPDRKKCSVIYSALVGDCSTAKLSYCNDVGRKIAACEKYNL